MNFIAGILSDPSKGNDAIRMEVMMRC